MFLTHIPFARKIDRRRIAALGLIVAMIGLVVTVSSAHAETTTSNAECTLLVPDSPLTATGLSTPYTLSATSASDGACDETNAAQAAFVQATVLDPATGKISVYNPLVINAGTTADIAPVVPTLPENAVVGIWFGFQGKQLTLTGDTADCVNGGTFAYCNSAAFFTAANTAIASGLLTIPSAAVGSDNLACLTTRDFGFVDATPSDGVTTTYLVSGDSVVQNTTANATALSGEKILSNEGDNSLLVNNIDKALGCSSLKAPDLANNGALTTSIALNELQAAQNQADPVALVPSAIIGATKANQYRAGVNQSPVSSSENYCENLRAKGVDRLRADEALLTRAASPDSKKASNLYTFMAQRLFNSYEALGCANSLSLENPLEIAKSSTGVAINVTFVTDSTTSSTTSTSTSTSSTTTSSTTSSSTSTSSTTVPDDSISTSTSTSTSTTAVPVITTSSTSTTTAPTTTTTTTPPTTVKRIPPGQLKKTTTTTARPTTTTTTAPVTTTTSQDLQSVPVIDLQPNSDSFVATPIPQISTASATNSSQADAVSSDSTADVSSTPTAASSAAAVSTPTVDGTTATDSTNTTQVQAVPEPSAGITKFAANHTPTKNSKSKFAPGPYTIAGGVLITLLLGFLGWRFARKDDSD